jgi:hypothetical protein
MAARSLRGAISARHIEGAYGGALAMVLAAVWLCILAGQRPIGLLIAGLLQGVTLLVVLQVSGAKRKVVVITSIAALIATGLASGLSVAGLAAGSVLWAGIVLAAIATIGDYLRTLKRIDVRVVLGLLTAYLLLGLLFAHGFQIVGAVAGPFFTAGEEAFDSFAYFSFVTMTTTGYGDLVASPGTPRAMAVTCAVIGQLYLVTVVALAVGRLSGAKAARAHPP